MNNPIPQYIKNGLKLGLIEVIIINADEDIEKGVDKTDRIMHAYQAIKEVILDEND